MVGDAIYDVIVVEYDKAYQKGLNTLVKRLRQRFVDATIIVVNMWGIGEVNVVDENNEVKTVIAWLDENGIKGNTPEARTFIEQSNVQFELDTALTEKDAYMNKLVQDYNVKLLSRPIKIANVKAALLRFAQHHASDIIHWSKDGHQYAANSISEIVKTEETKRSDRVGSWGRCNFTIHCLLMLNCVPY